MSRSEQPADLLPGRILTVVIRNDGPLIFCDDSPSYRSVHIELTDEQRAALALKWVGLDRGIDFHETISRAFIEPEAKP